MKPEDHSSDSPSPETQVPPLEVMRRVFQKLEIGFEEDEGTISFRLNLVNLEVLVFCWGEADDLATVVVRLPVRAAPKFRAAAGEFLHRLNYNARRKFWEIDYNDGEIRLAAYTDTIAGPLTEELFRSMFHSLAKTADTVFPYLSSVLSGRMSPEFANDQTEAAIVRMMEEGNSGEDE